MKFFYPMIITVCILSCLGCGPRKPENMPDVFPCTVTVTKASSPVANASVILIPEGAGTEWVCSGSAADGVVKLKTRYFQYEVEGAPAGTYKIVVDSDFPRPDSPNVDDPALGLSGAKAEAILREHENKVNKARIVPLKYTSPESTPLRITVESGAGATQSVDVAK